MTVLISMMHTKPRAGNAKFVVTDEINNRTLSLKEYEAIAKRCIAKWGGNLTNMMLKSEDCISFVVEELIIATYNWNSERGRTFKSYLAFCARKSIIRLSRMVHKAYHSQILSLDIELDDESGSKRSGGKFGRSLGSAIVDALSLSGDEAMEDFELHATLKEWINSSGLTERQKTCVELHYVEGMKAADIARHLGISREAVRQNLERGRERLEVSDVIVAV